ncbi:hypothetical protein L537_0334 [Bordetella hinzii 1277]|uniref:hypothetical protein n=1 Tax=Bordetella hinzii TaxID=103855 RepID=UPI00045B8572|nr:hypothetical protein [Bordetella hinzii]KCB47044.1 hypothetical protein L537_0334 [Bordetella hinzii 1277]QDJ45577.1 hypothetical protein CBR71_07000 [Bordetella hinzii]WPL83142.1 hypothetical protein SD446_10485 [Bordetella hinzii]
MTLEEMSMKDLLTLHNQLADKPANPKTFSTRSKLVARIEQIAEAKDVDLSSFRRPQQPEAAGPSAQQQADAVGSPEVAKTIDLIPEPMAEKAPRGKDVGALARQLLMNPAGTPHAEIAAEVNRQIAGAQATDKSVRWYAHDMRKKGIEVPPRKREVAVRG